MRTKFIFFSILVALAGFGPMQAFAQQDEDVRGAFLTTRPKATPRNNQPAARTKSSRRRPKTSTTSSTSTNTAGPASSSSSSARSPAKGIAQRMGLGLTLFMRDSNGLAVRTDPSHEFHQGDRVRVLLETNADGFLYIFNTTDNGEPVMIYPDPELDEAGDYIQAHVPFEIPSSVAPEERLRWFSFDQNAGTEKIYFVFTREPLSAVPIEDDLVSYCREKGGKCPWHPGAEVWAHIQSVLNEPVQVAKAEDRGKVQTSGEHRAATRGLGLNRDDPEPSLIMLTASTTKNVLVATLDLIHKSVSVLVKPDNNKQ